MGTIVQWSFVGIVVLVSSLLAHNVYAWGDTAHEIICEIAFKELNSEARRAVMELIKKDAEFSTFSESCTWPDHPRRRGSEHFVNLTRADTHIGKDPCPLDKTCVVTAIDVDFSILSQDNTTESEKLKALKYLGHWVGDIHQPLHVSFKDDRGGNEIRKQGLCGAHIDNLHAVWDTCIIEQKLGKDIRRIAHELRDQATTSDRAQWTSTGIKEWANESLAIATAEAVKYCLKTTTGCSYEEDNEVLEPGEAKKLVIVDEAYLQQHLPTIRLRLAQAGIRLGKLLNQALGRE